MNQRVIYIRRVELENLADTLDRRIGNPIGIGGNEIVKSIHSLQILRGDDDKWHAIVVLNTQHENARPVSASAFLPEKDFKVGETK